MKLGSISHFLGWRGTSDVANSTQSSRVGEPDDDGGESDGFAQQQHEQDAHQ